MRQPKTSRVKPVHKNGEQSSFCNYRLISLLPPMSKIFEYVIFNQLMLFLTDNVSGLAIQRNWPLYG